MAKHKIPAVRPHHQKAYRRRHMVALAAACIVLVLVTVQIGITFGRNTRIATQFLGTGASVKPVANAENRNFLNIRSGYGFSVRVDSARFMPSGVVHEASGRSHPASYQELIDGDSLAEVTVRPQSGSLRGQLAATELSIAVNPEAGKALPQPASHSGLVGQKISETDETLNNATVQKTVYSFTDKQGGTSYVVVWSGTVNQRAYAVKLAGLVGSPVIPAEYNALLGSVRVAADQAVLGVATTATNAGTVATTVASTNSSKKMSALTRLDSRYLADALSPAVVQIFHTVCGVLTVSKQSLGGSNCVSFSGSGFLVTPDGYIATNGHVVVYGAKDAVANILVSDETVLQAYLRGQGLNAGQIAAVATDPAAMAAQIAKIYDLPDDELRFSEKGESWLVALGSDVPDAKALLQLRTKSQLAAFTYNKTTIKPAKIVGYNYAAKDVFTTVANPRYGFSASDVALLKIDVRKAPTLLLETNPVLRNQPIIVMGFPGDAGNSLIDNTQTDVTVTNGVVSAIRQAAGGKGKLYQSDADASHGNSGGPAIDEAGRVIGLLTYRYSDGQRGDAAKSYIRDITDFSDLARAYDVRMSGYSRTQQLWENGLANYSHNHYSAALKDFRAVQAAYPAHRLAAGYIASSEQAIKDGKDVKELPIGLLFGVAAAALLAIAWMLHVIIRHRAAHHIYRAQQELAGQEAVGQQAAETVRQETASHSV